MKSKIVRFLIVSTVFTVVLFLVFWLFDLIGKKEIDIGQEFKYALSIGVLSGLFIVFLTKFFK